MRLPSVSSAAAAGIPPAQSRPRQRGARQTVGTSVQAKKVLVLGAGINGAAVARELVLSGVSVIVVDSDDVACGATAWSTRLVHGGLRYLEYGEVGLVRESLAERERLVRLAGHLVEPLPFYIPLERRSGGMLAAGARLAGWTGLGPPRPAAPRGVSDRPRRRWH